MPTIIYKWLSKIRDSLAATVYNKLHYEEQAQHLTYLALNSQEMGVTGGAAEGEEIIVSLVTVLCDSSRAGCTSQERPMENHYSCRWHFSEGPFGGR